MSEIPNRGPIPDGPLGSALRRDRLVNYSPDDPRQDPRLEAEMAGMFGNERNRYERDPLGLYSPAVNYAESMLSYAKLPLVGSAQFELAIESATMDMMRRNRKKQQDQPNEQELRHVDVQELTRNELEIGVELNRNFSLAIGAGNRSVIETLAMLESMTPPKPFEANMQERRFTDARQSLEAMATYFGGIMPERIGGWFRIYDQINEQQYGLFNILCAAGGSLEGYYDALKQAGETLISRARYHASVDDFRATYTNDDPGVSTIELTPAERSHIKDTLASKEIRELNVEMLSQSRRLILCNVDVAQMDMDKPAGQDGVMRLRPEIVQRKIRELENKKHDLTLKGKDKEVARVQKHID